MSKRNALQLIDSILAEPVAGDALAGALEALRKTGGLSVRIAQEFDRYNEKLAEAEGLKAEAKELADEAKQILKGIKQLRSSENDLGDICTLAEREAEFIPARAAFHEQSPDAYTLVFGTVLPEVGECDIRAIQEAVAFIAVWDVLDHFPGAPRQRKREIDDLMRRKSDAVAAGRPRASVKDGTPAANHAPGSTRELDEAIADAVAAN